MAWVVTAVVAVGVTVATVKNTKAHNKKLAKRAEDKLETAEEEAELEAEEDILEQEKRAREAEIFANREGGGLGSLGRISLDIDDDDENGLSI